MTLWVSLQGSFNYISANMDDVNIKTLAKTLLIKSNLRWAVTVVTQLEQY